MTNGEFDRGYWILSSLREEDLRTKLSKLRNHGPCVRQLTWPLSPKPRRDFDQSSPKRRSSSTKLSKLRNHGWSMYVSGNLHDHNHLNLEGILTNHLREEDLRTKLSKLRNRGPCQATYCRWPLSLKPRRDFDQFEICLNTLFATKEESWGTSNDSSKSMLYVASNFNLQELVVTSLNHSFSFERKETPWRLLSLFFFSWLPWALLLTRTMRWVEQRTMCLL